MKEFCILFPFDPISWERAGRRGHKYFDRQLKEKEMYRLYALSKGSHIRPFKGALFAFYIFFIPMPKSWSKNKREERKGDFAYDCKKDLSNLVKFIEDTFNKVIYEDDKQIVFSQEIKVWDETGSTFLMVGECK